MKREITIQMYGRLGGWRELAVGSSASVVARPCPKLSAF